MRSLQILMIFVMACICIPVASSEQLKVLELKGESVNVPISKWAQEHSHLWSLRTYACDVHDRMSSSYRGFAMCVFTDDELLWNEKSLAGRDVGAYIAYFSDGRLVGISYILQQPQDTKLLDAAIDIYGQPDVLEKATYAWVSGPQALWVQISNKPKDTMVSLLVTSYIDQILKKKAF